MRAIGITDGHVVGVWVSVGVLGVVGEGLSTWTRLCFYGCAHVCVLARALELDLHDQLGSPDNRQFVPVVLGIGISRFREAGC